MELQHSRAQHGAEQSCSVGTAQHAVHQTAARPILQGCCTAVTPDAHLTPHTGAGSWGPRTLRPCAERPFPSQQAWGKQHNNAIPLKEKRPLCCPSNKTREAADSLPLDTSLAPCARKAALGGSWGCPKACTEHGASTAPPVPHRAVGDPALTSPRPHTAQG